MEQKLTETHYERLFRAGIISAWYLRDSQKIFYDMLGKTKTSVCKCHRRYGKSTTFMVYVCERAATEKLIMRYGGPTQKQAYEILDILLEHIYLLAPQCKPKKINGVYAWPSGSRLHVFGMKDKGEADKARGTEADIIICDEYGFWAYKPDYILKSVLYPQTDTTDGIVIITSTPPVDLTHPYVNEVAKAEAEGYLFEWSIDDSLKTGEVTELLHKDILERYGGAESAAYKREYECLMIPEPSVLVIPESIDEDMWAGTNEKRPDYYNYYCCMDLGFIDYFAVVYGYLDFSVSRLVIEREVWQHYKSTGENVERCLEVEYDLDLHEGQIRRWGDCADQQQLWDMTKDHGYKVTPIVKRSKMANKPFRDSVINQLRLGVQQGKLLIDTESCPNLAMQLKYGHWNERRTDFERTDTMGHLDLIMALAYLYDNVNWHENPYGIGQLANKLVSPETHFVTDDDLVINPRKRRLGKLIGRS